MYNAKKKQGWKMHREYCELIYSLNERTEPTPNFEKKGITNRDIKNILEEKENEFATHDIACSLYDYYDHEDMFCHLDFGLRLADIYWFVAEYHNACFLYEKYFDFIIGLMKICPVLITHLIYHFVMCRINMGLEVEALNVIFCWSTYFRPCKVRGKKGAELRKLMTDILEKNWAEFPKHEIYYCSVQGMIELIKRDIVEQSQLYPFMPAILAIVISGVMNLSRQKDEFDNFRKAIDSDNGGQLER